MNLEIFFSFLIDPLREYRFTLLSSLILGLSFLFILVVYHWSGLAEKIESLRIWKRFVISLFVLIVLFLIYYVFYKAGKFDQILSLPFTDSVKEAINETIKSAKVKL